MLCSIETTEKLRKGAGLWYNESVRCARSDQHYEPHYVIGPPTEANGKTLGVWAHECSNLS